MMHIYELKTKIMIISIKFICCVLSFVRQSKI